MTHYLQQELSDRLKNDPSLWALVQQECFDGIWYWDLESPDHEWMSARFWTMFGYDPADMPHSPNSWFDIIDPDDQKVALVNFRKHIDDPDHPYDQVVRYRHAEGHTVWVRCRGVALRNAQGRATRMLGIHTDVTDTVRRKEQHAQETFNLAARLTAIFGATQSAILGLGQDRSIMTLNPPSRRLLGGLTGTPPLRWPEPIRFFSTEDLTPLGPEQDPVSRALSGQLSAPEIHLMNTGRPGAPHLYVRLSSAPVDSEGTDVKAVLIMDDVTEQEQNRQQVERQSRLDALGQLTGGIAHDFNNLLSTILYANTMLQEEVGTGRAQRLLDQSLKTIERCRTLTDRLLAFAKQKHQSIETRTIGTILDEFGKLARLSIDQDIDLKIDPTDRDASISCDQYMLENALLNLVLNSRDAILRGTGSGKIHISAEAIRAPEERAVLQASLSGPGGPEQSFVRLTVADDGPGMEDEVRRRATDPFFTTKPDHLGSGLGLSMVFGFVQQSHGLMRIASTPGKGTRVALILPSSALAPPPLADQTPGSEALRGQGETILLVEDEPSLLSMMQEQLEAQGYTVVAVGSGLAARTVIENDLPFDILVSDVVMPGDTDGFALVRRLRETRPGTPAILLSGYAARTATAPPDVDAVILDKPCPPKRLGLELRRLLGGGLEAADGGG